MAQKCKVPLIGFVAYSGTGKTTLLTKLIPLFKKHGLNVGVIKHSHHHFEIDQPGKDSFRLRESGARSIMIISPRRIATIQDFSEPQENDFDQLVTQFSQNGVDLILIEGFKSACFPKIELHRVNLGNPFIYPKDSSIIAIASDQPLNIPGNLVNLDLNKTSMIYDFIIQRFFS